MDRIHIRKLLLFFMSPHPIFLFVLLDRMLPSKEGSIFFIRRRVYSLIKTERIFAGRGEYFLVGREKYFFPSLGKEKSAFFRRIAKGYGVAPYTAGETPVTKTVCRKKCGGFVNFL